MVAIKIVVFYGKNTREVCKNTILKNAFSILFSIIYAKEASLDKTINCKELTFRKEEQFLSEYAKKSIDTKGRTFPLEPCSLRTEFQRDRDRIIHSKAFRRLKHKTQVFIAPEGDHYRTRLTHTLEVSQIARTIARAIALNEDLCEAIALGHDLGHTPFGHAGELAFSKYINFSHNKQSLRMVEHIANDGKGMNLCFEVKDGILNHTSKGNAQTLEGHVVAWSDRIAYINHDIDDAIRAGILKQSDIPQVYIDAFGDKHSMRINSMILDIIQNSFCNNFVTPSINFTKLINGLRSFMFEKVYRSDFAVKEETKAVDLLRYLFDYYLTNMSLLPQYILAFDCCDEQKVCDYISTMSDNYAINKFEQLSVPKCFVVT